MATVTKKAANCIIAFKIVAIGFVVFIIALAIRNSISNKEINTSNNEWKKTRPELLALVKQAVENGDHETAFSLGQPYISKKDAELKALLYKAAELKRNEGANKKERFKKERSAYLIAEIKGNNGESRASMIQELFSLDPSTGEFPDEIKPLRERAKEVDNFIANGKGEKVPFTKWDIFGEPKTLEGTNDNYWVAHLPEINVCFVSEKATDKVIFIGRERKEATDFLTNMDVERKEIIEKGFSAWDGSHRGLTNHIKEAMNDPNSYEHVETKYWDKGDHLVVRTTFRGKNAFGAVIKNWLSAKTDLNGNVLNIIGQGQ